MTMSRKNTYLRRLALLITSIALSRESSSFIYFSKKGYGNYILALEERKTMREERRRVVKGNFCDSE